MLVRSSPSPTPGFFGTLTIRGRVGSILYGKDEAATFTEWSILRRGQGPQANLPPYTWHLRARVTRAVPFYCRRRGLLFTAPRDKGNPWCWGVESLDLVGSQLRARLGPPEQ